jgi:hypothetical protein
VSTRTGAALGVAVAALGLPVLTAVSATAASTVTVNANPGRPVTINPCAGSIQLPVLAYPVHGGIEIRVSGDLTYTADATHLGPDQVQVKCAGDGSTVVVNYVVRKPAAPVTMTFKESCVVNVPKATAQLTFSIRNRDTVTHDWSITSASFPKASGTLAAGAATTDVVTFTDSSATVRTRVDRNLVKTKVIANNCTSNDPTPIPGGGANAGDITPDPAGVGGGGTGGGFLAAHHPHATMRFQ